jgi:hypothetical protein
LEKLAGLQCTQEEAAAWFGVSLATIKRRLREDKYRAVWENGLGKGRISLRRHQFRQAEKSPAMAIFLGKQYLGQVDRKELEVGNPGDFENLTDGQLDDQHTELDREIAEFEDTTPGGETGEGPKTRH